MQADHIGQPGQPRLVHVAQVACLTDCLSVVAVADGLIALLGFNALFYLNILVSVTVFVTVLLTLVRWYRDSEMIVWFSSGVGLADLLRPILLFAAPFFVAIVVLSLFLSPWAEQRKLEYERQLESRDEIALLTGMFRESPANLVVFVKESYARRHHS